MSKLSDRIQRVEPSPTLAVTARANAMKAEGIDVIGFGAGEPDFDTPQAVRQAAKDALDSGKTRYTPASGLTELRAAVAQDYQRRGRKDIDASQVVMTVGGKQALYNATQVLFDPGDEVIVPAPYWVSYPAQLQLAGATPITAATTMSNNYKLSAEELKEILEKSKAQGLILCSPSNPSGATYAEEELRALADVLVDFPEVTVFFDAIYDRIYYEGEIAPDLVAVAPELEQRVVTFNGFSKTYAMTGWRLGYAIGPEEIIAAMGTLQSQSTSNATSFVQYGGLAALELEDEVISERCEAFRRRRDLIVSGLRSIEGVQCPEPTGAFYAFADFSHYVGADAPFADDMELTEYLLTDGEVAVVPGSAFGVDGSLRLSYAMGSDEISAGIERIAEALKAL